MSVKTKLRHSLAQLLSFTGLTAPRRRSQGRFSIVTFHRVLPESERQIYPYPGLVVTPQQLDSFLAYLTDHFDCGALSTQHERYLSKEILARPLLALTFDDGQYDNYLYARPVLAKYQVKASFFAPVAAIERQELLWHDRLGFAIVALLKQAPNRREQLQRILAAAGLRASDSRNLVGYVVQKSKGLLLDARLSLVEALEEAAGTAQIPKFARLMAFEELAALAADGHEIGSHSMTHCMMTECDDPALLYELSESRNVLEARLRQPIESFCYPNGNCDARTADAVAKAGYRRAVTTSWGINGQCADRFQLRRFDIVAEHVQDSNGNIVPAILAFRMSGFYPGLG